MAVKAGPWKKPVPQTPSSGAFSLQSSEKISINPANLWHFFGSPEDREVAWSHQEVRDSEGTVTTLHNTQPHQWVRLPRALLRRAKVVCSVPRYLDRYLLGEVKKSVCVLGVGKCCCLGFTSRARLCTSRQDRK